MTIITHSAIALRLMNLATKQYKNVNLNDIYYTKTSFVTPDSLRMPNENDYEYRERIRNAS